MAESAEDTLVDSGTLGSTMPDTDDQIDEGETVTAADVLRKLEEAWRNEKLCPDILEHQTEVTDCILEQIREMEGNLKRLPKSDFRISVHRLEIERIRFLLSNYLKIRLEKIEKYCASILSKEKALATNNETSRLSVEEMEFAKSYFAAVQDHLKNTILKKLPANIQNFDAIASMPSPDLSSYVFLRVNESTHGVLLREDGDDRDEVIDLEKDSQHLLPYQSVAHLLASGAISLI